MNEEKRNASRMTRALDKEDPDRIRSKGQTFTKIATLSHASRRGVWFHVLCGELHTHNTFRAADSLSEKGMICYYVDRAWQLYSFLARFSCKDTAFFLNCANFLEEKYMEICVFLGNGVRK